MLVAVVFVAFSAYPSPTLSGPPNCERPGAEEAQARSNGSARSCETTNFQVESHSARCDARTVADRCESWRKHLQLKWLGAESRETWSTRCVVVVHAHRETYRAAIGRGGEQSFGSSFVNSQGDRISDRRIDLMIDPKGAFSALGHELTHLVIADAFPGSRPPAWANEGAAVLADSIEKQQLHKRDLDQSFRRQAAFHCAELIQISEYPSSNRIAAFYGQSASLAAFLAQVGGPEKFVPFVKQASNYGYDYALRESYGIQGVAELQRRWYEHQTVKGGWPQVASTVGPHGGIASTP
jgi:hypothetical protein